jgi:hypothetical protein
VVNTSLLPHSNSEPEVASLRIQFNRTYRFIEFSAPYDTVLPGRWLPTFRKNILRLLRDGTLKVTRLHGVITQKIAVKTSDLIMTFMFRVSERHVSELRLS